LSLIIELLGRPPENILKESSRKKLFFDAKTGEPNMEKDANGKPIRIGVKTIK
jgi:hypothetical protein